MENNPFDRFGIKHLSPSSLNKFVSDPVLYTLSYIYKIKEPSSAPATRGHVVEHALSKKFSGQIVEEKELISDYTKRIIENNIDLDNEKALSEKENLYAFYQQAINNISYKGLIKFQDFAEIRNDDLPIPIIGYIDFVFEDCIVDLKTTNKMPSKLSEAVKRQMACYSLVYPNKKIFVEYVSSKKHRTFEITDIKKYQDQLFAIAIALQKFLGDCHSPWDVSSKLFPNLDNWAWSEYLKTEATKIWRQI